MAGPAVGRSRTGRPGEIQIAAYACRRSPGASADAGSIPAASTLRAHDAPNVGYVVNEGGFAGLQSIMTPAGRPPGCGCTLGEHRYMSQWPAYAPSVGF